MTPPAMMPASEVSETTNHIIVLSNDMCKVYSYYRGGLHFSGIATDSKICQPGLLSSAQTYKIHQSSY